jgi:hypothetical protein
MAISLFDQLCTIVWYKTVAMALNAQNPNAVATKIDELRAKDYADRGVSTPPSFDVKSFAPYANGKTTPSKATLHLVDSLLASSVANTAYTFTNGPFREAAVITIGGERHVRYGVTELWTALAGTEIGLRTILEHYNKDIRKMQVYGHADVLDLALKLVDWLPIDEVWEVVGHEGLGKRVEEIVSQHAYYKFTMDDLTVIVCLFRLSMQTRSHFPLFNNIMNGLYARAIPKLMDQFGVSDKFIYYLRAIANHYFLYLKKVEAGTLTEDDSPLVLY